MRSSGVIAATVACSLTGCLDTKADTPAPAVDAGAWQAGAGSVRPPLAQPSAGSVWLVQAGAAGAPQRAGNAMQPTAAGSRARPQAGVTPDAGVRRNLPIVRARASEPGMADAGASDAEPIDAGAIDAGASEAEPLDAHTWDGGSLDAGTFDAGELPSEQPLVEHPGDLIITELMIDPKALSDAEGEWIELYNATKAMLELRDCQLDDGDDNMHDIPAVLVEPGAYFTIAREAEPGFSADLVVPLSLTNRADSVAIVCRGEEIDRVSYDEAADFAIKSGASLALDPEQLDAHANDSANAWCESHDAYAADLGTPGHANASCHGTEDGDSHEQSEWEGQAADDQQPDAGSGSHDAGEGY